MAKALTNQDDYPIKIIGAMPGEKIQELLVSEEEMYRAEEFEDHYVIYDYGILKEPKLINKQILEYGSLNTEILDKDHILELLKKGNLL
jgi:FlaA1/EpsC-like NDP-sugar epimerase